MDPVAVEAGLSLILEVVFEMVLLGLYAIPAVYFIPMPGILANVSGRGFDLIAPRNVVSEVNLDKSSPNNDHVGDAANGYASNVSSTNGTGHTNGYSPNATEPSNVDYYYYCSGLDVSAGGTIDCGSTIGTTAAEGPAESTPYSTLRFSFATTDGELQEEVALEPEQAMSHSELFTPSFFTNEHPDTREDGEEILEAAQEDSTVVFLQKTKTEGDAVFQAPFGFMRVLPDARPELHVFSPTDIAFLQGSSSVVTDTAPAVATVTPTNARLDTKDRVNSHPDPVGLRLLKPVPLVYLDLGAEEVFGTAFWKTSAVGHRALLTRGQLSVLHHQPHLYDHRADGSEFTLSFLDPGATEPEQFGHELGDGKVDTWDPRALGEHRNDHLVRTQGIPLDCVWLDFGAAADRARQVKPRVRGGRKEDWRLPRLANYGLEETRRACVGPDGDVEDTTAKQVLWTLFAPESDVKECLELTRNLGDDSLPVDRLCAIEAGPMRDWAGPVLKETAENAIADWPSDLVADDLLLASGTLPETTSLAVAFRRRQLLLVEHLVQMSSPAVMEAKGNVIARARGGRSGRRGARDDFFGKADQSSRFDEAPAKTAVPAPIVQPGPLSMASDVDHVAGGEDAAAPPSAGEEDRTVSAWGAPLAYTRGVLEGPKAVLLAEETPEENDRQVPLLQPTHSMGRLDPSLPTKDFLAHSEGDPMTEGLPTTFEKSLLPVTYCYVGPGAVSTIPKYMLDRMQGDQRKEELPTTTEKTLRPVTYSYVGPGAASTSPGVSESASTKSEAVAHSGEKSAGADTALSSPGSDRPMGLGLDDAATSETVESDVAFFATQGLPVVPEHPVCTPSDDPVAAVVDADRETGDTPAALEAPATSITGGDQGLATVELAEEAAPVPDLDSQSAGSAWPAVASPFDMKGATSKEVQLWLEASRYRRRHPLDESTREYYRQLELHRERKRSEAGMLKTAPLPGAQGLTGPTAPPDTDAPLAGIRTEPDSSASSVTDQPREDGALDRV